jgi:hypothetical protein
VDSDLFREPSEPEVRLYGYISRVLQGETPEVDPDIGVMLVGMVSGSAAVLLQKLHHIPKDQAVARAWQRLKDEAQLVGMSAARPAEPHEGGN